ncbi:MAG: OB-fold nucleic acid binding domain-containing protein [Candidatus Verstraetearchaeota archaeon]|jgi:replication factor A1|nr:OB-fold nucleic acid binding domain-containing protein [Candidatus Verstraetearchaeota archaeon]
MKITGKSEKELKELIEEKKKSLGYLIDDEVAIYLIAKDYGVTLSEFKPDIKVKIGDLVPMMKNVTLIVTVDRVFGVKEFIKKDNEKGKIGKAIIRDDSGSALLVVWNDKAEFLHKLKPGTEILIKQAYTRESFDGLLEVHIGSKGEIQIISEKTYKGIVWKIYDLVKYKKRDGSEGRVMHFILKSEENYIKVFIWNPSDEFLHRIIEGCYVEIIGGRIRNIGENIEIYVDNENDVKISCEKILSIPININKLKDIKPNMENLVIEGIIDDDPIFRETKTGKKFAKIILKDDDFTLPVIFWGDKAELLYSYNVKKGTKILIDGCYSKIGVDGLEIIVSKWSKIKIG